MTLGEGEQFAGYTIVRQLGSGGMGEVYLAKHPRLPRQEALKVLHRQISDDDTFRQRFIREADSIAALEHPNIVTVHDRGDSDGQLWIATQYVDGTDAAKLLSARQPAGLPADEVAQITTAIAQGLDHAHDRGVLHRDVKPANILLSQPDRDGVRRIYLADFGIARPLDDPAGLTATNFTLGTVAYAAPEQLMGRPTDGRADQYGLAATAFHLLTGTQLFNETNPVAVISHHLNEPPPAPSLIDPALAAFDPAFSRALAKNPEDRYPRCQDFAHAITAAAAASGVGSPTDPTQQAPITPEPAALQNPGPRTPARWLLLAGVVVFGLLAGSLAWWRPWSNQQTTEPIPTTTPTTTPSLPGPPVSATPSVTAKPPPPVTTSLPPPPPPPVPAAPKYPPAGALGEWCSVKDGIGIAPDGTMYYCSRLGGTDGYQWALSPGVIPNPAIKPYTPAPAADIDPLGPNPMDRCTNPGAIARGTLGLMECNEFLPGSGWFVWGVRPR